MRLNYYSVRIERLLETSHFIISFHLHFRKKAYSFARMYKMADLVDGLDSGCIYSERPVNFEGLDQPFGFVAYTTVFSIHIVESEIWEAEDRKRSNDFRPISVVFYLFLYNRLETVVHHFGSSRFQTKQ